MVLATTFASTYTRLLTFIELSWKTPSITGMARKNRNIELIRTNLSVFIILLNRNTIDMILRIISSEARYPLTSVTGTVPK